jgi:type III pantothenate kinase
LLLDIGNTNAKLGLWRDGGLTLTASLSHRLLDWQTFAEKRLFPFRQALCQLSTGLLPIGVFISSCPAQSEAVLSVVRSLLPEVSSWQELRPDRQPSGIDLNGYPAERLGADRLANLCAARFLFPQRACLIGDFGTAVTLDLLDAEGRFLGGVISPGLSLFSEALHRKIPQLPNLFLPGREQAPAVMRPSRWAGQSTQACLESGTLGAYGLMLDSLFEQLLIENFQGEPVIRLATGGDASTLNRLIRHPFDRLEPQLTLTGIARWHALCETQG